VSVHLAADKHLPGHWEQEFGFSIAIPSGWGMRGLDFDRPISADAFILMALDSEIVVENYVALIDSGLLETLVTKSDYTTTTAIKENS
jgi:hypothetical protein